MRQEPDRQRSFARRALLLGGAQGLLLTGLAARLYDLQIRRGSDYRLLADENRIKQKLLLPARGRITDRDGRLIAFNHATYRVHLIPERAHDLSATLERLAPLLDLDGAEREALLEQARVSRKFKPLLVRDDLGWEQVAAVAVRRPELPGVELGEHLERRYPYGEGLAHLLGYVGPVNEKEQAGDPDPILRQPAARVGKDGIEKAHEAALRGRAGFSRVEVNAAGREIRELERVEGQPGQDLTLSLDLELQRFCFERLSNELAAAAVVMDVNTGAVLAMASVPSFEPGAFESGVSHRLWNEWRDNPRHPLVNKALRGEYPPGSTFKMITGLAALEAGVSPDYEAFCPGHVDLGRARFHCWKRGGHGRVALKQALAQSCDVYFYDVARKVGVDALAEVARRFGMGDRTGIDLPGEKRGLIPTSAWKLDRVGEPWQRGETLIAGIGQGFVSSTPLQLAVMTARLCNGGYPVRPWLVRGQPLEAPPPSTLGPIADLKHLRLVVEGMHEVVNGPRGTARQAALKLDGVELAGKTGTSQVKRISRADRASGAYKEKNKPWRERDHALFVCYAPYDAPRYAVSVIVEHGQSGSKAASPVARDIMTKALSLNPEARLASLDVRAGG